jgi:hypothetical protein
VGWRRGGSRGGVASLRPLRRRAGRGVELAALSQVRERALPGSVTSAPPLQALKGLGRGEGKSRGVQLSLHARAIVGGGFPQQSEASAGVTEWMALKGMAPPVRLLLGSSPALSRVHRLRSFLAPTRFGGSVLGSTRTGSASGHQEGTHRRDSATSQLIGTGDTGGTSGRCWWCDRTAQPLSRRKSLLHP